MSLLSYNSLKNLVQGGVIDAPLGHVNGASIDITLGEDILTERAPHQQYIGEDDYVDKPTSYPYVVDLQAKRSLELRRRRIPEEGFRIHPGEFILATSNETFNLPNNVACEYKLKSSLARSGLQHMLAGWCDPGWNNSKLTLELKNVTQNHILIIRPGMKIGQMVFFECEPVPDEHSYAVKGQYNDQDTVTGNKGVR